MDFSKREVAMGGRDWQPQHIVGERQTPSGLEYEVSVQKTLWLPRATVNTKLVRRYNAEQRARPESARGGSSRLQRAGSSAVVNCLVEDGL